MKPAVGVFRIEYRNGQSYEPDFVVETVDEKFICEPKMEKDVESQDVKDKARAAIQWCKYASDHAKQHSAKPWSYVLMPHTAILSNSSFEGLVAAYRKI